MEAPRENPRPERATRRSTAPPRDRWTLRDALGAAALAGLSGCLVGPDYRIPEAPLAERWSDTAAAEGDAAPLDTPAWWEAFGDPVLERLVTSAREQNLTLRQAGLRVLQAQALRGLAASQLYPQAQTAAGEVATRRESRNTPLGAGDRSYEAASVGVQAVWELDLWGRFRRGIESADAALEAALAEHDAFAVALAAEVASAYVTLRSLQEQIVLTRANVAAQRDTLALTVARQRAGAVSELDVAGAEATLANTEALVPVLADRLRQAELALGVLLGRPPADLVLELGPGAVPTPPAAIALGVPADLLRRRPDVRAAERTAAALSARIGAIRAERYPAIALSGRTGFRTTSSDTVVGSPDLGDLFGADSFEGFVGLGVQWPLLDYRRIKNRMRAADARFEEGRVAYQQAVLVAAAEVEGGLSRFLRSREQAERLAASVRAARRSLELALIQYRQGAVDFLRVDQAQSDLVDRQNRLVLAQAGAAGAAIATFRALGGGWEVRGALVPRATAEAMRARTDWGDVLVLDPEEPEAGGPPGVDGSGTAARRKP